MTRPQVTFAKQFSAPGRSSAHQSKSWLDATSASARNDEPRRRGPPNGFRSSGCLRSSQGVRDVHGDPGHPGRLGIPQRNPGPGFPRPPSEVSWVQTSYRSPEVIAIPLSGFLSRAFGTRLLFAISASGFTIASSSGGFASTIEQMCFWRVLQGFLGAGMIPTGFASAYTCFRAQNSTSSARSSDLWRRWRPPSARPSAV